MSFTHTHYSVAWICALPWEMAAAKTMLDETHGALPQAQTDNNCYTLGRICGHNVVIACLPSGDYGTTSAAVVLSQMLQTFTNVEFGLMVGIGGGVPAQKPDIRLGDVVVSIPTTKAGGVVQYDYGKSLCDGHFQETGSLNKPPMVLLNAVTKLRADSMIEKGSLQLIISNVLQKDQDTRELFARPCQDWLFSSAYNHPSGISDCSACDQSHLMAREPRATDEPQVHYGLIASGNQVMKDAKRRDSIAKKLDILCFEMEAAGLMDQLPVLVIRGICDYCDSHKSKIWQAYAALSAATYTKLLLKIVPCRINDSQAIILTHPQYSFSELSHTVPSLPKTASGSLSIVHSDARQNTSESMLKIISHPKEVINTAVTSAVGEFDDHYGQNAYEGNVEGLKLLLSRATYALHDIDQKHGRTALHYAVMRNHIDVCEFLRNASANVHAMDYTGMTPTIKAWEHILTRRGSPAQIQKLKTLFPDIDFCDDMGFSHIHMLVLDLLQGDLVETLKVRNHRTQINKPDFTGKTPLHWAATRGDFERIEILLKSGANVAVTDESGGTPLMFAGSSGSLKCLKLLLYAGSIVHSKNHYGSDALYYACRHQSGLSPVIHLLKSGACLNTQNNNGHTALIGASIRNNFKIGRYLLRQGATIDVQGANGETALFEAIFHNSHQFLRLLLEWSSDYTIVNHDGSNILHSVALEGDCETVNILLCSELKGLNPLHRNKKHLTAMEMILKRSIIPEGFRSLFDRLLSSVTTDSSET
ncbi:hypothetical protein N7466_007785 [Penicillium verhagenii]|uniref:uncharacterized protein n=1 Tax=Penicillium verhagenii TaxID=1562060 RepID=UPI0025457EAA|nr:uncharacterized protein N7466_007785 [Penicillium verhagenii]KAJ5928829.1 hypothetical protein N7466_007785 [Penicillium verhagenii]